MGARDRSGRNDVELIEVDRLPAFSEANTIQLSLVLPAYNECERIETGLEVLIASIERGELGPDETEIIVVDDGSTDDTAAMADRLLASFINSTVIRLPHNRGKGAAIRSGVARARGATIAFMDVDMAVHPSQLPLLLDALAEADVAVGSRALPDSKTECDSPLRIVMGRSFSLIVRSMTHLPLRDTQCGFKAYRAPVARLLFHCSTIDRFAFDVEIFTIARQLGFRLAEVPVNWCHKPDSRIRPLVDSTLMMADLIRTRRGRQKVPSLNGIVIGDVREVTSPADAARSVVGPIMPIIQLEDNEVLVLLPLCDTNDSESVIKTLREVMPRADVRPLSLTPSQFGRLAPLLIAEQSTAVSPAAQVHSVGLADDDGTNSTLAEIDIAL
jgi:dolichyl-phosphate beta-glucosyltransferase